MDMLKGLNEALKYMEDHLDGEIDLKEVARKAYCSEFHFKRMFSLLAGLTLSEYIRRRRLTLAAMELKDSDVKVIDVAVKYGYQSPDAFSRAFQAFHGVTPTIARERQQNLKAYPRLAFQLTIQGGIEMNYRILEKEAFKVIGVKREVQMVNNELSPSYEEIVASVSEETMKELAEMSNDEPHGIIHVSADYTEDMDGKATFNQYIGAVTTKEEKDKFSALKVPALTWAIFEVDGEWERVEEEWQRIYAEWLPSSSYELAEGPEILASRDQNSEIWIPIKRK